MAATGTPDRVGVGRLCAAGPAPAGLTYSELLDRARAGAALLVAHGVDELVYVGVNADDFAVVLFAAAWAGIPLVPLNYRLSRDALERLLAHHPNALVISDLLVPTTARTVTVAQWRASFAEPAGDVSPCSDLFVEGRTDDTIIRGGENIAPAEIEDVLLEHPAVADVAVFGIPDEHWGQDIAAALVFGPGHTASTEELRRWARTRLRGSKTPALIVVPDALPQTATGKVLRRELLADLLATDLAATS
jgi:acyl-CoA synthetase (AMP-forming)/AMP-acid ligase II